ncbi:hypothetical protein [Streptomyces tagetis]|uniref:DUF1877 family protein n=1 Tax=Streptomyces tagetis TaxID=2820809 RepID=A0A940XTB8_9ACTN|nr:hypothetical protein [Streptomyces sp. RG38]MBQ0830855.1 hypothetical protein [Streptomyces sp. RG38]
MEQGIGPGGDWLEGRSLEGAGVDWVDAKNLEPSVVLGQLVAYAEGVPFGDLPDGPVVVWPEEPHPRGEVEPDSPWDTGLILQHVPDRWRDVLADLPEDSIPGVAGRWYGIEEVDFGGPLDVERTVSLFAGLARRAREAGAHLYCRCSV